MKNNSYICGVFAKGIILIAVAGISFSTTGKHRNYGLPISCDFCTATVGNVFGETEVVQPFLHTYNYNFSFAMPKTARNCKGVQGMPVATYSHETGQSLHSRFLIEKNAKNKAYAFILSSGILSEFAAFSRTYKGEANTLEGCLSLILKNC